jgi:hypothetical protein
MLLAVHASVGFLCVICVVQVWRTMLEGALMEDRAGNTDIARTVLRYIYAYRIA